jgi:hypothetical protein
VHVPHWTSGHEEEGMGRNREVSKQEGAQARRQGMEWNGNEDAKEGEGTKQVGHVKKETKGPGAKRKT